MSKARATDLPLAGAELSSARTFAAAAMSARFIGVAAVGMGAVSLYSTKTLPPGEPRGEAIVFGAMFVIPGMLYVLLAGRVARGRKWAIQVLLTLAMLDMALLGALLVTSLHAESARVVAVIAGAFVVALLALCISLGRAIIALRRS